MLDNISQFFQFLLTYILDDGDDGDPKNPKVSILPSNVNPKYSIEKVLNPTRSITIRKQPTTKEDNKKKTAQSKTKTIRVFNFFHFFNYISNYDGSR